MEKGRSNYTLQVNADAMTINQLVQNFLSANGFNLTEKDNEQYYKSGNAIVGYEGFKYSINGQMLSIDAWIDGGLGNFPLEGNSLNANAVNYRNQLNSLFQAVSNLNASTARSDNPQENLMKPQNPVIDTFRNETIKKQETMCEIGFWISIVGVILSLFGVMFGVFIYIFDFYFASQGLKTRKKGKAIATIVLSIVSIVIILLEIIVANSI